MPSKVQDAAGSESSPKPPVTAESGAKSEAVQVAVRVRPLSANEASQGSETCLDVVNGSILLAEKQFDFDVTFPATSDQESVYTTLVAPMVDQFFAGYNATVLAYGQTGTGKTYTMGNEFASSVVPVERGVILRVVQDVFERVEASANPQHFVIRLSYLEILNEEIHDLLNVAKPEPNPPPKSTGLSVRGDSDRGIVVSGLSEHVVNTMDQAEEILRSGALVRATASTTMNARSSRSHAICTFVMEQYGVSASGGGTETRLSKFHLVDLAGSERVRRTNSEGARFREGVNINRGLLALGNVINALCERNRTSSLTAHVPYRDSKLTRLLQDSLGGNSKTLMIACISPADVNYEETFNTLRYASRTREIENKAVINKERGPENEVVYLKQQLEIVRLQLLQQTQSASSRPGRLTPQGFSAANGIVESTSGVSALEAENRKLKAELSLANNEKKKWKQIANELTDKNKNESEFAPSKAIGSHLDVSAPIKKNGAVNDGEYGKSGPLSRLEQLRKFQSHKVKSQHSKDDTAVKRKNGDYTPANMHTRTLMSPSTSTPDTESKILNARMALVLPSHIKRSRVGESAALIMGTITKLLQQVLASQESIYNAKVDVRVNLANRNALALEISQLEGSSSTENTERLARLRSDLRSKSANIRLLQQKLANVGKNVSLPSGLFPIRLETCHDLIRHLIETLVGFKEECMVLQSDAANERIMSQQEAHSKVQALGKRLKEALKEMQTLREQSTKKKAAKKRKARESYETMDTLFSSSSEEEDNTEADSDYVDEEVNRNEGNKRKRRCRTPVSEGSKRVDAMDEIDELLETSAATCCACYGKCATKACACKSQNRICNNECSCNSNKCQNRGGDDNTGESSGVVHDSDEVLGMTVSDVARSTPKRGAGDFASETSSSTTLMNPTVTTYTSPIIDLMSP
ncbi:hypothetical protein KRP22_008812 [Phytophthora ramorum]|nr:Kinesin-like protein KIN-4A [Phytophthora ramorum]